MNEPVSLRRRWTKAGMILLAFTLLGLFDASLSSFHYIYTGEPHPGWKLWALGISDWYLWAALTPFILGLARRVPIRQDTWRYGVPIHFAVSLAISFLIILFDTEFYLLIDLPVSSSATFQRLLVSIALSKMHLYLFVYWAILGIRQSLEYYRKLRERELQATRLQGQLAQAQLEVLKMQLHPHFLFNTLNTISALIHQNVDVADRMIARLGEMLRVTLENSGTQEVPLCQEVDFIQAYLEIEKARLGDRLAVTFNIEPEVSDALVPNLILQPLVENAVRHGIAPYSRPGRIELNARREANNLTVEIKDNGPGLTPSQKSSTRTGLGLANTRARLEQLYPALHRLEISNGANNGFAVTLLIPFHEDPRKPLSGVEPSLVENVIS